MLARKPQWQARVRVSMWQLYMVCNWLYIEYIEGTELILVCTCCLYWKKKGYQVNGWMLINKLIRHGIISCFVWEQKLPEFLLLLCHKCTSPHWCVPFLSIRPYLVQDWHLALPSIHPELLLSSPSFCFYPFIMLFNFLILCNVCVHLKVSFNQLGINWPTELNCMAVGGKYVFMKDF